MINALKMDERDNVVTCVKEVKRGEDVVYQEGASEMSLVAEEDIPYCHKVALSDLAEGTEIIKYGESLGKLVAPVKKGHWVNDKNLKSVPRDYESELAGDDFVMQAKQSARAGPRAVLVLGLSPCGGAAGHPQPRPDPADVCLRQ